MWVKSLDVFHASVIADSWYEMMNTILDTVSVSQAFISPVCEGVPKCPKPTIHPESKPYVEDCNSQQDIKKSNTDFCCYFSMCIIFVKYNKVNNSSELLQASDLFSHQ
jgi:hypothetical protein